MSGSKAPDFDAYGLFRAAHSHNPTRYEQAHVGLDLLTLASYFVTINRGYKCLTVLAVRYPIPLHASSGLPL